MEEYDLATTLAQKIGDKILDAGLNQITDPILSALGLGGAPSSDAYFQQFENSLQQINVTLAQISGRMIEISGDIAAVQTATTAISMQVSDAELQTALEAYTND